MASVNAVRISEYPFESPVAHSLIQNLETDLAAFYPDWDQFSHPNFKANPKPRSPQPTIDGTSSTPESRGNGQGDVEEQDPGKTGFLFFVAFDSDIPVGCVALRLLSPSPALPGLAFPARPEGLSPNLAYAEVKRMYVAPSHRGLGLAKHIIAHLEKYAFHHLKIDRLVLEVGLRQKAAVRLYRSTGFSERAMYGEYIGMEVAAGGDSICMEKMP